MDIKKYFLPLFFLSSVLNQAKYISHESSYSETELVDDVQFKHSSQSINGKREEKFFVDDVPVLKKDYLKELDEAKLSEFHKDRELKEKKEQDRLDFQDQMNMLLLKKIAILLVDKIKVELDLINNELLKPYFGYAYDEKTVQSFRDLSEMREFIKVEIAELIPELIEDHDAEGLQELIEKIEQWPDKLEHFFKDTVRNGIEKSDDTAALKELLAFVS